MRLFVGAQMVSGAQVFCGGFSDPLFFVKVPPTTLSLNLTLGQSLMLFQSHEFKCLFECGGQDGSSALDVVQPSCLERVLHSKSSRSGFLW
jgi:hypothetical protein